MTMRGVACCAPGGILDGLCFSACVIVTWRRYRLFGRRDRALPSRISLWLAFIASSFAASMPPMRVAMPAMTDQMESDEAERERHPNPIAAEPVHLLSPPLMNH
ncbi:MAG: hypothetical protein K2P94_18765 [Rhodospirillaceae bacterium]|nr:hypothetical protein [Rhodospirillaceae bacterium]